MLFDFVPIENYIFSLLHAEIGVENKIVYTYFDWIRQRIKPIFDEELAVTNVLINLKNELNKHEQEYNDWIKHHTSSLTDLR